MMQADETIQESAFVDGLKTTLIGLVTILIAGWCVLAIGTVIARALRDDDGTFTMGWEWYHWLFTVPLWLLVLVGVWGFIFGVGAWVRERLRQH